MQFTHGLRFGLTYKPLEIRLFPLVLDGRSVFVKRGSWVRIPTAALAKTKNPAGYS
jgi:hypothetical protein